MSLAVLGFITLGLRTDRSFGNAAYKRPDLAIFCTEPPDAVEALR